MMNVNVAQVRLVDALLPANVYSTEHQRTLVDRLRLPNGMYVASTSSDYNYTWLRDTFYEVMPWLHSLCDRYVKTYYRIFDMLRHYEDKLRYHTKHRPFEPWQYIHAKYDIKTVLEVEQPWGHAQHDAIGAILFGIGEGIRVGKKMLRDEKDREIVQLLVDYLACCQYWEDPDNGMWEEWREVHSSSVGACVAGLKAVRGIVNVPSELIFKGNQALSKLWPMESVTRQVDLSQLSLVYPYKAYTGHDAEYVVQRVEAMLLRSRGVCRYLGDKYYATNDEEGVHHPLHHYHGHEAEWTFGLPWLALCHMEFGNYDKARRYIKQAESVMLPDGSLPELYYANSNKYNGNTPLGWSNAMFILAKEKYEEKMGRMG